VSAASATAEEPNADTEADQDEERRDDSRLARSLMPSRFLDQRLRVFDAEVLNDGLLILGR
jgi:hypothetical protein